MKKTNLSLLRNVLIPIIAFLILSIGLTFGLEDEGGKNLDRKNRDVSNRSVKINKIHPIPYDTTKASPKVFIPSDSFDFGIVKQESSYTHDFVIRNIGNGPLKLLRAKGS